MKSTPTSDWRSLIKVHPAAEMFPELEGDEFRSLAKDIHQQGLKTTIHTWFDEDEQEWLLDGRNRLNVMEELGYRFQIVKTGGIGSDRPHLRITEPLSNKTVYVVHHFAHGRDATEPYNYVTSLNIRRRHLTTEQRKDIAAELLKANPARSDRSVANEVGLSPTTVGTIRETVEPSTVQTGQLEPEPAKRVGADGKARKRPAKPARTQSKGQDASPEPANASVQAAEPANTVTTAPTRVEELANTTYTAFHTFTEAERKEYAQRIGLLQTQGKDGQAEYHVCNEMAMAAKAGLAMPAEKKLQVSFMLMKQNVLDWWQNYSNPDYHEAFVQFVSELLLDAEEGEVIDGEVVTDPEPAQADAAE